MCIRDRSTSCTMCAARSSSATRRPCATAERRSAYGPPCCSLSTLLRQAAASKTVWTWIMTGHPLPLGSTALPTSLSSRRATARGQERTKRTWTGSGSGRGRPSLGAVLQVPRFQRAGTAGTHVRGVDPSVGSGVRRHPDVRRRVELADIAEAVQVRCQTAAVVGGPRSGSQAAADFPRLDLTVVVPVGAGHGEVPAELLAVGRVELLESAGGVAAQERLGVERHVAQDLAGDLSVR